MFFTFGQKLKIKDYHNSHLKFDVFLLADNFETIKNNSTKDY